MTIPVERSPSDCEAFTDTLIGLVPCADAAPVTGESAAGAAAAVNSLVSDSLCGCNKYLN